MVHIFPVHISKTGEQLADTVPPLPWWTNEPMWFGIFQARYWALRGLLTRDFSLSDFYAYTIKRASGRTAEQIQKFNKYFNDVHRRKWAKYLNVDGSITVLGNKLRSFGNAYTELIGMILEIMVMDTYWVEQYIHDGDIVIDAGANMGVFSFFTASLYPRATIHAFEPAPTFETLAKNAAPFTNVKCHRLGLGEIKTERTMKFSPSRTEGATIEGTPFFDNARAEYSEMSRVQITTIDEVAKELPSVDFIKIDTEGYERNILKGAEETIRKFHPTIIMEAFHNAGDLEEIPKLIKDICPSYTVEKFLRRGNNFVCRAPRGVATRPRTDQST